MKQWQPLHGRELWTEQEIRAHEQDPDCVFCAITRGESPSTRLGWGPNTMTIEPLNPVTPGHAIVIPRVHVADFTSDPVVSGRVMKEAAVHAATMGGAYNLITSKGPEATQTVHHLHVHLVPRREGDGLHLPWTGQGE